MEGEGWGCGWGGKGRGLGGLKWMIACMFYVMKCIYYRYIMLLKQTIVEDGKLKPPNH